jgi:transporter family protein
MPIELLIPLIVICFGSAPLFEKAALVGVSPIVGVFIRVCFSIAYLSIALVASGKAKELFNVPAKNILLFAIDSILLITATFLFAKALKTVPVSKLSPLSSTYPLITALLGLLIFREHLSLSQMIGVLLVAGGVYLLK